MLAEERNPASPRALSRSSQHSDYEVDTALDGLTALEYLLANDYDAAILDIMMPGMVGIEVLKRTRAAGKRLPSSCSRQKARCPIRSRAWMPVPTIT